eukprot:CAMPEP_0204586136 /NCGR_PEP_ID=MMETSP0661-20131031/47324_1 /ASSEMBLY_ACC=CAM_ASM_000606 /TAXON_ID=109239 /ORGANISM="Alexandrium margalefi, Strain AMGDE01CS-322" /LENGTH=56 /DNA_ID=CAMNT_0051595757 /DNA_START=17 /DNA_END=184 /DNA_ORIENTATION=-
MCKSQRCSQIPAMQKAAIPVAEGRGRSAMVQLDLRARPEGCRGGGSGAAPHDDGTC